MFININYHIYIYTLYRKLHLPPNGMFGKIPLQNLPFFGGFVSSGVLGMYEKILQKSPGLTQFPIQSQSPLLKWRVVAIQRRGGATGGWKHLQYLQVVIDPL